MEQRNANFQATSGRSLQQTEPSGATKKPVSATPMPCTSTGCLRFGTPGKSGLCEVCFRKQAYQRPTTTSASQTNKQWGLSSSNSLYTTCPTQQNRQMANSAQPASYALQEPVQVSHEQSPSPLYGAASRRHGSNSGSVEETVQGQRCRGTNCTLFGTPETNGYCFRCFLESTIPQSGPSSIPGSPLAECAVCIGHFRNFGKTEH